MEYKGELKGFPDEVVTLMVKRQSDQGNKPDFKVFEYKRGMPKSFGGFNWDETPEGFYFWSSVNCYNFHTFFEKYPKKSYPKVMMVSDNPISKHNKGVKRVVFMEKNSRFIAWNNAETLEEAESIFNTTDWEYAKDIDEIHDETVVELTIEDISKGKGTGIPPHLIRIKQ